MIYLIRHAESMGNIGARTAVHSEIPLSENGLQQAKDLIDKINFCPELIVISPFLRTRQTAAPLLQKYPEAKVEYWPVQEFSFLDEVQCANSTPSERAPFVEAYFARNDLDYVDGVGAESFNQLLARVDEMLRRLRQRQNQNIVVFKHGNFLRAVTMRLRHLPIDFATFRALPVPENTEIMVLPEQF